MTKTAIEHASVSKIPVKNHEKEAEENEPSESPPLVIKFLETLPPEKELTFIVEVVERPKQPPPQTKIVGQNPDSIEKVLVLEQQPKFKVPKLTITSVASVVKSEVKLEIEDEDLEEEDEEEEDSLRIIEETVVDIRTLPGRIYCYAFLMIRSFWSMTYRFCPFLCRY